MNEIMYGGSIYEYRCSANNGEMNVYVTMDGTKAVIIDRSKRVLLSISSYYEDVLSIYQM